jgi:hypothetical protein
MTELLTYLVKRDVASYKDKDVQITHHDVERPQSIKLAINEVAYIHNIRVITDEKFELTFLSAIESRKHYGTGFQEYQNISRHIGTIKFFSTIKGYFIVSYVKLKIIK